MVIWLVAWNMAFIFPYIGKIKPNWLPYFSEGRYTTNQDIIPVPVQYYGYVTLCLCFKVWKNIKSFISGISRMGIDQIFPTSLWMFGGQIWKKVELQRVISKVTYCGLCGFVWKVSDKQSSSLVEHQVSHYRYIRAIPHKPIGPAAN